MKSPNRPETTADRLLRAMVDKGLRQSDVLKLAEPYCERTNISLQKSALSQYVSGQVEPGQDKLYILALALDVNEAWLMGYNVPMERDLAPELCSDPGSATTELFTRLSQISLSKREAIAREFLAELEPRLAAQYAVEQNTHAKRRELVSEINESPDSVIHSVREHIKQKP